MSGKKKKYRVPKVVPLPRYIRDELRITCALNGFNNMKCRKSKKLPTQHNYMSKFYHGQEPNNPSQIKLLANAHINFRELFDEVDAVATSKKDDIGTAKKYMLKSELTRDTMRNYYSDVDITYTDLEKKNRTIPLLITGHNILDMAV